MLERAVPSAPGGYVLDSNWRDERDRLDAMTALFDPGSVRVFDAIGVAPGWRCCEVGAGTGTLAAQLAERVGPTGSVLAVDIDTRFVAPLASDTIEVRTADVTCERLPVGAFDLVHARLLLEHLPQREAVLSGLMESVRPDGWLVVEDFDWVTAYVIDPPSPAHDRVVDAVLMLLTGFEYDASYGRRLPRRLREVGLVDVSTSAVSVQVGPDALHGLPQWELLVDQLVPQLLGQGLLLPDDLGEFTALWHDGVTGCFSPLMVSCWGRRAPLPDGPTA